MSAPATAPEPRLGKRLVTLTEICDAALELLHSVSLSVPFIARRSWLLVSQFEDMGVPTIDITPGASYLIERESRSSWRRNPTVALMIRQRIDGEDFDESLDRLMSLVEEIREAFAHNPLPVLQGSCVDQQPLKAISIDNDPVVVLEHLETLRQFTSGLLITYSIIE